MIAIESPSQPRPAVIQRMCITATAGCAGSFGRGESPAPAIAAPFTGSIRSCRSAVSEVRRTAAGSSRFRRDTVVAEMLFDETQTDGKCKVTDAERQSAVSGARTIGPSFVQARTRDLTSSISAAGLSRALE